MEMPDRLLLRSSHSEDTGPAMGILLGRALALEHSTVVVSMDAMKSSSMMKEALVSSLVSCGADVIDLGCTSAPVTAFAASQGDCAVYVTEYPDYGLIGGYLLMNPDGSPFRRDQIRRLDRVFSEHFDMPDHKHLGVVKVRSNATSMYNARVLSLLKDADAGSLILNCSCGSASDSAPQIISAKRADLITMNAQDDRNHRAGSLSAQDAEMRNMRTFIECDPGCIGISLNRIGTLAKVLSESGTMLTEEQVLAMVVIFMRPARMVVPSDISSMVEDVFRGEYDLHVDTPYPEPDPESMMFIRVEADSDAVCDAFVENDADLGYFDGGILFKGLAVNSDAIFASAVLAQLAGDSSLERLVREIPAYLRHTEVRRFGCAKADFARMMSAEVERLGVPFAVFETGWRVQFSKGWFLVRFVNDSEDSVEAVCESKDPLYLAETVKLVLDIVERCSAGQ